METYKWKDVPKLRRWVRKAYTKKHKENKSLLKLLHARGTSDNNQFTSQLRKDLVEHLETDQLPSDRWFRNLILSKEPRNFDISEVNKIIDFCEHYLPFLRYRKYIRALYFLVVLALILVPTSFLVKNSSSNTISNDNLVSENDFFPLFNEDDERYKIMIVPFDVQCEHDGSMKNVGKVIELRLEVLNVSDSLNLNVRYVKDFVSQKEKQDSTWTHYFERVMKENNADHIIYGATREENCTPSNADEICINYVLNNRREFKGPNYTENKFEVASLYDISDGKWQESIDFVIYMNAVFSIMNSRPQLSIEYLNEIIQSSKISRDNLLLAVYTRMQLNHSIGFTRSIAAHIDSRRILDISSSRSIPIEMIVNAKIISQDTTYIKDTDQWIKESPDNWKPYLLKAKFYNTRDKTISNKNIKIALNLVKTKKDKILLYQTLGNWSLNKKQYFDASQYFSSGLELGESYALRYGRATCYSSLNKYSEALNDIKRALEIYDKDEAAYQLKGSIHLRLSEPKEALHSFRNALRHAAFQLSGYFYAIDMIECNYYEESLELINEGIERANNEQNINDYDHYIVARHLHSKKFGNTNQEKQDSIYLQNRDQKLLDVSAKHYRTIAY